MDKTFKGDFDKFLNKIKNKENFSITRFGDGEMMIIDGIDVDLLHKGPGEYSYKSNDDRYDISRKLLKQSFTSKMDEYYVGISCRCCVGDEKYQNMKKDSGQNENNLTWANIFVNSNFNLFNTQMIPALKSRRIYLICHKASDFNNLPFGTEKIYKVGTDAWLHNLSLIDELKNEIKEQKLKDVVFLIAAGPFANILSHQLYTFDKNNTYIDLGSVLDKYLNLPITRGYLKDANTLNKICIW